MNNQLLYKEFITKFFFKSPPSHIKITIYEFTKIFRFEILKNIPAVLLL